MTGEPKSAGEQLKSSLHDESDPYSTTVMVVEACRIADRLDKLNRLLVGDEDVWFRLVHKVQTDSYELVINSALSEARQQANALRQLLADIRRVKNTVESDDDDGLDGL